MLKEGRYRNYKNGGGEKKIYIHICYIHFLKSVE